MNHVLCDGGLSNRLGALIFALILKRKFGHDWQISWPQNSWCGASFDSLFASTVSHDQCSIQDYKARQAEHLLLMHENQIGFDADRLIHTRTLGSYEDYRRLIDEAQTQGCSVVYFNNQLPGFVTPAEVKDALTLLGLNSHVAEAAGRFIVEHRVDARIAGVHIRKTDFGDAVNDDALFAQVQASAQRFFVCSDDAAVNQRFAALPNCVVFEKTAFPVKREQHAGWQHRITDTDGRQYPFNITRSGASVVEGLIDLLILSQTGILGTSGSTFLAMSRLFQVCGYFQPHGAAATVTAQAAPAAAPVYVEYQFIFKGKPLKMAGRPQVDSDRAIINMVFQREMFALERWQQTTALNDYMLRKTRLGLKPLLVDAGANIGAASLYFNQIYAGLKTVAIEPDAENAKLARHNLGGLDAKVIEGALGKEIGLMYINDIDFSPISYRVGETGNKAVESHTIPSLLSALDGNSFPFILKIDIEGGEDIVFANDTSWLNLFPLVIIELHDWMLPFQNSSRNFFRNIATCEFDIINHGENTFCFNRQLLQGNGALQAA